MDTLELIRYRRDIERAQLRESIESEIKRLQDRLREVNERDGSFQFSDATALEALALDVRYVVQLNNLFKHLGG